MHTLSNWTVFVEIVDDEVVAENYDKKSILTLLPQINKILFKWKNLIEMFMYDFTKWKTTFRWSILPEFGLSLNLSSIFSISLQWTKKDRIRE